MEVHTEWRMSPGQIMIHLEEKTRPQGEIGDHRGYSSLISEPFDS